MAANKTNTSNVDIDALTKEIKAAVISESGNATPIIVRLAWHASGTYCDKSKTGGSDGATMRYSTELGDAANAGLEVAQRILDPVAKAHPEISLADLWTLAGAKAIEFAGGPSIPHKLGRIDADSEEACPPNGRLPDATQGAEHLREVFYRMGFNDQEIVALSGAHTLGRCHKERSGFEGPWTEDPYKFDNSYFTLLLNEEWKPKQWDGPLQYEDATTGKLMMLPTDLVLVQDANFKKWVEVYAADQAKFFEDFAHAFAKLLSLGCPSGACPMASRSDGSVTKKARVQ